MCSLFDNSLVMSFIEYENKRQEQLHNINTIIQLLRGQSPNWNQELDLVSQMCSFSQDISEYKFQHTKKITDLKISSEKPCTHFQIIYVNEKTLVSPKQSSNLQHQSSHPKAGVNSYSEFLLFVFIFHFLFSFAVALCFNFLLFKRVYHWFSLNLKMECRVLCQNRWNWTKTMLQHRLRSNRRTERDKFSHVACYATEKSSENAPQHGYRNHSSLIIPQPHHQVSQLMHPPTDYRIPSPQV